VARPRPEIRDLPWLYFVKKGRGRKSNELSSKTTEGRGEGCGSGNSRVPHRKKKSGLFPDTLREKRGRKRRQDGIPSGRGEKRGPNHLMRGTSAIRKGKEESLGGRHLLGGKKAGLCSQAFVPYFYWEGKRDP